MANTSGFLQSKLRSSFKKNAKKNKDKDVMINDTLSNRSLMIKYLK